MLRRIVKAQQFDILVGKRLKRLDFKFGDGCFMTNRIVWKLACGTPLLCFLEISGGAFCPRISAIRTIDDTRCNFLLFQIGGVFNDKQPSERFLNTHHIANMVLSILFMRERKAPQDFLIPKTEISQVHRQIHYQSPPV